MNRIKVKEVYSSGININIITKAGYLETIL
jgi:hypothetical protein